MLLALFHETENILCCGCFSIVHCVRYFSDYTNKYAKLHANRQVCTIRTTKQSQKRIKPLICLNFRVLQKAEI